MADNRTSARPYAIAAFKQATEEGRIAEWSDFLGLLAQITADPTMKGAIANPRANREQLVELILDVGGGEQTETERNFVRLLAEYHRLGGAREIHEIFEQQRNKVEGRSRIVVRSAYPLDESQSDSIRTAMSKRLGKDVEMTVEVDEALIGGVTIRAGDMVIDASLRGRLAQLGQSLT